jgi:hypothetical protein
MACEEIGRITRATPRLYTDSGVRIDSSACQAQEHPQQLRLLK